MISDALFVAIEEIKMYRSNFPHVYKEYEADLVQLLRDMERIRNTLESIKRVKFEGKT